MIEFLSARETKKDLKRTRRQELDRLHKILVGRNDLTDVRKMFDPRRLGLTKDDYITTRCFYTNREFITGNKHWRWSREHLIPRSRGGGAGTNMVYSCQFMNSLVGRAPLMVKLRLRKYLRLYKIKDDNPDLDECMEFYKFLSHEFMRQFEFYGWLPWHSKGVREWNELANKAFAQHIKEENEATLIGGLL